MGFERDGRGFVFADLKDCKKTLLFSNNAQVISYNGYLILVFRGLFVLLDCVYQMLGNRPGKFQVSGICKFPEQIIIN